METYNHASFAEECHMVVLRAVHGLLQQGAVRIDSERCKGCDLCVNVCPAHTLRLSDGVNRRGYHRSEQIRPDRCIGCASCALVCPDGCITVFRDGIVPHRALQSSN